MATHTAGQRKGETRHRKRRKLELVIRKSVKGGKLRGEERDKRG